MNESPALITLDQIASNPYQVRDAEDPLVVAELAANIEKNGLLQPPTVRLVEDKGQPEWRGYEIAFGHTRLAAFKQLVSQGKTEYGNIPCFIKELDDLQMFEMAVAENIKRRELNPIERAKAMHTYMTTFRKTSAETGEFFGCEESTVRGAVRLLGLPETAQEKVSTGEISVGNARKLLTLQRVAPSEVESVIKELPESLDPDSVIADALRESEGVVALGRSWDNEPDAGDGLWPLSMAAKSFTRLPELRAADAAKSLGWEFTALNRPKLEAWISGLESPLYEAYIPLAVMDGADQDAIEHLAHLQHPPACTACPSMARSGNSYYCGMKLCHERKKRSFLITAVEQKSQKLGIAVYDPKVDGKDMLELSGYQDKDKKLFTDRDADLRLRAAPRSYNHAFTDSSTVEVILVGKRAEKVKETERKERESQPKQEDYHASYEKRKAAEKKVSAFLWNRAAPLFIPLLPVECLPLLEAINEDISSFLDVPEDAIPFENAKSKTKIEFLRRMIVGSMLVKILNIDYEDSDTPVTIVAKHLQGVARTWGVTLPKDWMKKAEAEDQPIENSEQ